RRRGDTATGPRRAGRRRAARAPADHRRPAAALRAGRPAGAYGRIWHDGVSAQEASGQLKTQRRKSECRAAMESPGFFLAKRFAAKAAPTKGGFEKGLAKAAFVGAALAANT